MQRATPQTPVLATVVSPPAAEPSSAPSETASTPVVTASALPPIDASFFNRADMLYGSSIGSWPMQDGRYDGQYVLNYQNSCPACVQLARDAKIPVVGWSVWDTFSDQLNPNGVPGSMTAAQFTNVIEGIRTALGAYPFIRFQPNNNGHSFCPEYWGMANLLQMDEEIVRTAGVKVQLYELANEPNLDCGYPPDTAGNSMAQLWLSIVPALKAYARAQGFEIYVGGPAITTGNTSNLPDTADLGMIRDFLHTLRAAYDDPNGAYFHNPDVIPSFVSFHEYGIEYVNNVGGTSTPLDAIPAYGTFIDSVQAAITANWGDVAPSMRIAVSEWNVGADAYTFPEPLSATYYTLYLQMLRQHGVFMANQFLMAGNNNGMDMITESGAGTPYYQSFKQLSLSDPAANRSRQGLQTSSTGP